MRGSDTSAMLIVGMGGTTCALPLEHVAETMRPLPVEPVAGAPAFVRGVAVIRGAPVPVVDLTALLEGSETAAAPCTRFVTLKVGDRSVALAVETVIGVRDLDIAETAELPPLVRHGSADAIEAVGIADAQLLIILRAARVLPEAVWNRLAGQPA